MHTAAELQPTPAAAARSDSQCTDLPLAGAAAACRAVGRLSLVATCMAAGPPMLRPLLQCHSANHGLCADHWGQDQAGALCQRGRQRQGALAALQLAPTRLPAALLPHPCRPPVLTACPAALNASTPLGAPVPPAHVLGCPPTPPLAPSAEAAVLPRLGLRRRQAGADAGRQEHLWGGPGQRAPRLQSCGEGAGRQHALRQLLSATHACRMHCQGCAASCAMHGSSWRLLDTLAGGVPPAWHWHVRSPGAAGVRLQGCPAGAGPARR